MNQFGARFNPAHALDLAALSHPDRISIHYGSGFLTVKQAALRTQQLATLLTELGVGVNDIVVLVARNSPYHMLYMWRAHVSGRSSPQYPIGSQPQS